MDSDRNSNITVCIQVDGDTRMHVNINIKMTGGVKNTVRVGRDAISVVMCSHWLHWRTVDTVVAQHSSVLGSKP